MDNQSSSKSKSDGTKMKRRNRKQYRSKKYASSSSRKSKLSKEEDDLILFSKLIKMKHREALDIQSKYREDGNERNFISKVRQVVSQNQNLLNKPSSPPSSKAKPSQHGHQSSDKKKSSPRSQKKKSSKSNQTKKKGNKRTPKKENKKKTNQLKSLLDIKVSDDSDSERSVHSTSKTKGESDHPETSNFEPNPKKSTEKMKVSDPSNNTMLNASSSTNSDDQKGEMTGLNILAEFFSKTNSKDEILFENPIEEGSKRREKQHEEEEEEPDMMVNTRGLEEEMTQLLGLDDITPPSSSPTSFLFKDQEINHEKEKEEEEEILSKPLTTQHSSHSRF